ncbi:MAG: ester cyclase [Alphaproteobacteria bacterium]|nr:ester cyclase [Alphaproteobacteria bacterium]
MLSPENQKILIAHVEAETAHRMDETLATLSEDCVFDDRALGRVWHGRAGARDYYRMWWDGFAIKPEGSSRFTPTPDQLIVETRFVGTHVGSFLGVAPTGRPVDVPMAIFVSFAGGFMTGERFYWNPADLMAQVGVEMPFALAA